MMLPTMNCVKIISKLILFSGLLFLFYLMHMRHAMDQYRKGITALGEREEIVNEYEYPIFVICPEPGFKTSLFENNGYGFYPGHLKLFENNSVQDVYNHGSYKFGEDWQIPGLKIGENENAFPCFF